MSSELINELLKKKKYIFKKIFTLEKNNKISSNEFDYIMDKISIPPKRSLLKMTQVLKLFNLRYKGKFNFKNYILVIEPQNYNKVSKLDPKNYMFEKNILIKKNNKLLKIGYFHSNESGLAHSGDGGDHGDLWWLANKSLIIWLNKIIKIGENFIKNN
jgi:hypothetical protein